MTGERRMVTVMFRLIEADPPYFYLTDLRKINSMNKRSLSLLGCLAAFVFISAIPANAQNLFDWTGAESGVWGTAENWNPTTGAPPGTASTDDARFNASSDYTSVTLGSPVSMRRLLFESGADEFTLSGSRLTLSYTSGQNFIVHNAGNIQTINSELEMISTGGLRDISIGSGSKLVVGAKLIASGGTDKNVRVTGGGTIDIMAGFTGVNAFSVQGTGTTLNFRGNGGVNRLTTDAGARTNMYVSHNGDYTLSGADSSIYVSFNGTASGTHATNAVRVSPTTGNTVTLGADIDGGGTGIFGRNLQLFYAAVTNATARFDAKAGNILSLNGIILDFTTPGTGSKVEIAGAGVVRYAGTEANTSVTPILISNGTLELGKTAGVNAIGGGEVTLQTPGTLRLAASNQIANSTSLVFAGGLFEVGEFTDSVGSLTLGSAGGILDFDGKSGSITFASLSSIDGTWTINGWSESASIFFADGSGWNAEALSKVVFTGYGEAVFNSETGELYAIPEPSAAWLLGVFGMAWLARRARRVSL